MIFNRILLLLLSLCVFYTYAKPNQDNDNLIDDINTKANIAKAKNANISNKKTKNNSASNKKIINQSSLNSDNELSSKSSSNVEQKNLDTQDDIAINSTRKNQVNFESNKANSNTNTISNAISKHVEIYGKISVGVEHNAPEKSVLPHTTSIINYGSSIGFRGSEKISNSASVIWQIQQTLDPTTNRAYNNYGGGPIITPSGSVGSRTVSTTNTFASSDTYVGLNTDVGQLRFGILPNFVRSDMGDVTDIFLSGNGYNGLITYSRTAHSLPSAVRYDTPRYYGAQLSAIYSPNTNGSPFSNINSEADQVGFYSGGIYNLGLGWNDSSNLYSVKMSSEVWKDVGSYTTKNSSAYQPNPNAAYKYAYVNRLELGYHDKEGMLIGAGVQASSGLGWWSWANSGGSMNNFSLRGAPESYDVQGLQSKEYQTHELAITVGRHYGNFMPRIGYVHGFDLMHGGSLLDIASLQASKIAGTDYNQYVAELAWNLSPTAVIFVNAGYISFGHTLKNIQYKADGQPYDENSPSSFNNQFSTAIGFSKSF